MIWIWDVWSLPILLFQFAVIIVALCLLIVIGILFRRCRFVAAVVTLAGSSLAAFFFLHSGEAYMGWVLD